MDWLLSFRVTASFLGDITNRYRAETAIFALILCFRILPPLHAAVKLSMFSCLTITEMEYSSLLVIIDEQYSYCLIPYMPSARMF